MTDWTRDMVEERVLEAAGVLKKLPGPRAQGYFSTWPDMLLSAREIARQEPKPMKVLPSPQAISRMEETLTWNRFLEPDEAHLMWARAEGTPWKGICYRFGISRPTAHRRWDVCAQRDRVAAEWSGGAPPARTEVRDRSGQMSKFPAALLHPAVIPPLPDTQESPAR